MLHDDDANQPYRRKDWRRGWLLLVIGLLVVVIGLVMPEPDDEVECGSSVMTPGSYCGPHPICYSQELSDCGVSYKAMRSQQEQIGSLWVAIKWSVFAVGVMGVTGGVSVLLIGHARRHRLRAASPRRS